MALGNEAYLVDLSRRGDGNAFTQLIARHERPIYNLALRMVGSPDDAADITQEAFLRAWEKLPTARESTFKSWLFQIAVNLCHDHFRRHKRIAAWPEDAEPKIVGLDTMSADPSERAESNERMRILRESIAALEPEYRFALVLRDVNGLAYEEIAEVLEIPLGTVKSRIARARQQVQERLLVYPELFNITEQKRASHGG